MTFKQRHSLFLTLVMVMTILASAEAKNIGVSATESPQKHLHATPRLVVNILIDQLRNDRLETLLPLCGDGGFRLLLEKGRIYSQAQYPYLSPDLASAAATISSGTAPYQHGIVGKTWLDKSTLQPLFCLQDKQVKGLNTTSSYSPKWFNVSNLADELKIATAGRGKVVSIAAEAEAAVLLGGHDADHVVWLDDQTGNWASSDYYGAFPQWGNTRNVYAHIDKILPTLDWTPLYPNAPISINSTGHTNFLHRFKGHQRFRHYKSSALSNEEVAAMVGQALQDSPLGEDPICDLINVTFYAGAYQGKSSVLGAELQDTYLRLDRALQSIIERVEQKVGKDKALFILTASGKDEDSEEDLQKHRIPTGRFDMQRALSLLGMYLTNIYGQGNYIEKTIGTQIYLDYRLLEQRNIALSEISSQCQDFLTQLSGVKAVFVAQRNKTHQHTGEEQAYQKSIYHQRSGDINIRLHPGWRLQNGTTELEYVVRESIVPFPIIFYGWRIVPDLIDTPVTVERIAPTISKALRIRAPNACNVLPLF